MSALKAMCVVGLAGLATASAQGALAVYYGYSSWKAAVGGPTIQRLPGSSYTSAGQSVDPEVWSDAGVHLVSSGPLVTGSAQVDGISIKSQIGQTFEVRWDTPVSAVWFNALTPGGAVNFFRGNEFLGFTNEGELGVRSDVPIDRMVISFPQATYHGFLFKLEWGPVPSPGALSALCLAPLLGGRRKRADQPSRQLT